MRYVIAVLIGLHGVAHLVGFAAKWQLISSLSYPYETSILGVLSLKGHANRVVGLIWLSAALGCVFAGSGLWEGAAWSIPLAIGSLIVSLAVCVTAWPASRTGFLVSLLLLTLLLVRRSTVGVVL
jgi:hypothetical protein